jgi:DNA repair exonuclease SbcCD ATPase subunit
MRKEDSMESYPSSQELLRSFNQKKNKLAQDIGAARVIVERKTELEREVAFLTQQVLTLEKAAGVLAKVGEERQQEAQNQIESLVTQGLQKIFGTHLTFKVVQSVKGRTPVVDFVIQTALTDGTVRETDILSAMGGGVSAVTGFLLRLVVLLLDKSKESSILVLDETFAHVSDAYLPALAEFLREVVDKAKVQIIMVTHQHIFSEVADKAYKFSLNSDGYTVAKAL